MSSIYIHQTLHLTDLQREMKHDLFRVCLDNPYGPSDKGVDNLFMLVYTYATV